MSSPTVTAIPPLVHGERLTADEFHRRYEAMPHLNKAELIEGVVSMPSPVRADSHASPQGELVWWLVSYRMATPGVRMLDNGTVRLDDENEPQPDATLFVARGGRARVNADDYLEGAPEFAAEVSASTERADLGTKFRVYQRTGVREYLIWRTEAGTIDWFALRGGRYEPLAPSDGVLKSEAFPGLWLDPAGLLAGDLGRALAALQRGVASPEHTAFVQQLGAAP